MANTSLSRFTSCVAVLLSAIGLCDYVFAQEAPYTNVSSDITFTIPGYAKNHPTWPIAINGLEVDGKQVPLDTPVHLTGHWLAHLAVIAQNVSSKHIVWAGTFLTFPETASGSLAHPLFSCCAAMIGRTPDVALYLSNGTKRPRSSYEAAEAPVDIPPGAALMLIENDDDNNQQQAYQQAGGQITKVFLLPTRVWFGDNTRWGVTNYYAPAGTPGTWSIASPDQFLSNSQTEPISSVRYVPLPGIERDSGDVLNRMLPVGGRAPDFSLTSPGGYLISLAALRKQSKVTLINFWSLDCAPCLIEFPDVEKLYQEFHGSGLDIVAVDWEDAAQPVSDYAVRKGLTFPIALGGKGSIFGAYKVHGLPSSYLIDSNGRILYSLVGADVDALRNELERLGFN